jgi:PPM family protein phosphatase
MAGSLFAIADGSGEHGAVASRMAVEVLRERREGATADLVALLLEANDRVYECTLRNPDLLGMATTLTAALFAGESLFIAHIGDTRVYLVRGDALEQLTPDHRLISDLVAKRAVTSEEALTDPRRSVLTRTLGMSARVEPFQSRVEIQSGDRFLLTCDGVTDHVSDEELLRLTRSVRPPDEIAASIVSEAANRGTEDDASVIVIACER